MNATQIERVRTWIKDLRSGEYPQTKERLRDDKGFCCLGVACEQAVKAGVIKVWNNDFNEVVYGAGEDNHDLTLPNVVVEWFGFNTDVGPKFRAKGYGNQIVDGARMNDDGESFAEIADAIEKWLEKQ